MKVSFSESALNDLEAIKNYYAEQGVLDVGESFVADIFVRVETLIDHPKIGRVVPEFGEEHIREIVHPPFRVVYLRGKQSVVVIRVWRSEQKLSLKEG